VELQNRLAFFRIRDVHIPEPEEVLDELYGAHLLQGRIVELCSVEEEVFAVVRVEGVSRPLIVAVDRINVV
jgi:hypothetical protein